MEYFPLKTSNKARTSTLGIATQHCADTHNMDESPNYHAEWKKTEIEYTLHDYVNTK